MNELVVVYFKCVWTRLATRERLNEERRHERENWYSERCEEVNGAYYSHHIVQFFVLVNYYSHKQHSKLLGGNTLKITFSQLRAMHSVRCSFSKQKIIILMLQFAYWRLFLSDNNPHSNRIAMVSSLQYTIAASVFHCITASLLTVALKREAVPCLSHSFHVHQVNMVIHLLQHSSGRIFSAWIAAPFFCLLIRVCLSNETLWLWVDALHRVTTLKNEMPANDQYYKQQFLIITKQRQAAKEKNWWRR